MDHGHLSFTQARSVFMLAGRHPCLARFSTIPPVDEAIRSAAFRRLDVLTKPRGALGRLEPLAAQVCAIQGTLDVRLAQPVGIVFAKLQGIELWIVDAGVDGDCGPHPRLIEAKVRRGTRNFIDEPAMTPDECAEALQRGRDAVERVMPAGGNALVLGEMGIGNTAAAAMLMHGLTGRELIDCVGRGTGLDDGGLERKRRLLAQALERRAAPEEPLDLLAEFGGYEIAMLTGAVLAGAARRALVMVDGFTVTVAAALAAGLDRRVLDYCVFGHRSEEHAHRALLEHLEVQPLLDLGMRLGEGSGAALALSVVHAAVALFTDMATFEGAGVSDKDA